VRGLPSPQKSHSRKEENWGRACSKQTRRTYISIGVTAIKATCSTRNSSPGGVPLSYASVVRGSPPQPKKPIMEKAREIIVKLNDGEQRGVRMRGSDEQIIIDIHTMVAKELNDNTGIRGIKKLPSGDVAVQTHSIQQTERLQNNESWTTVLSDNARPVKKSYPVMVHRVGVNRLNVSTPERREETARTLQLQNSRANEMKNIKIVWVGWRTRPREGDKNGVVIVEFASPWMANAALDFGLVIGSEVFNCGVYNKACKPTQCIKCHRFGHIALQCTTKEESCGHCAGTHATDKCDDKGAVKCCICNVEGHKPWFKDCPHK